MCIPVFDLSADGHLPTVLASILPFAASLIWLNSNSETVGVSLYPNRGWARMASTKEGR